MRIISFGIGVMTGLYRTLVFMLLYNWFISELFSVGHISYVMAWGILIIMTIATVLTIVLAIGWVLKRFI